MLTIGLLRDNFKVELFVSTFNVGQGLIPRDWTPEGALPGLDYNPNRIFEATWENGNWNWFDRQGNRQTQPGSAGGLEDSSLIRPNWEIAPEVPFSNVVDNPDYVSARYTQGHLTDAAIRNRNLKDYTSTFLLSNTLPQALSMNSEVWAGFETDLRNLAKNQSRDTYVIIGGRGSLNNDPIWIDFLVITIF